MISRILQTNHFKKAVKRLPKTELIIVEQVIQKIRTDPEGGEKKRGDLSEVWVYKFKLQNQLFLLAYTWTEETLMLLSLASHENFYRDLKRTLN